MASDPKAASAVTRADVAEKVSHFLLPPSTSALSQAPHLARSPALNRTTGVVDKERVVRRDKNYISFNEIVYELKRSGGDHRRVAVPLPGPVPSFGIILYHCQKPIRDLYTGLLSPTAAALVARYHGSSIFYLVMQRRATIEYTTLILGNWRFRDLHTLFSLLTPSERERVVNHSFGELWDDLMSGSDAKQREYSEKRFSLLAPRLRDLVSLTRSNTRHPEIMFPKGRTNPGENELEAAKREFREETDVAIDECVVVPIEPFTELYRGSNGVLYSTKFFMMRCPWLPKRTVPKGHEASSVFWVSPRKTEGVRSVDNLDFSTRRRQLLESVHNSIVEYEKGTEY